jgi:hypothetical protein
MDLVADTFLRTSEPMDDAPEALATNASVRLSADR